MIREDRRHALCMAVDCRWAEFLRTRCEVGRDGKTANERLKGKSVKVQGISFAEGVFRVGGPLGKLTCMWEDGVYLGSEDTTRGGRRKKQKHSVAHEDGPEDGA